MGWFHRRFYSFLIVIVSMTTSCSSLPPPKAASPQSSCSAADLSVKPVFVNSETEVYRVRSVTPWKDGAITHYQKYDPKTPSPRFGGIKLVEEVVAWTSNDLQAPVKQPIDVETICRGGPLPIVGDDVVVCSAYGCSRIGQSGPVWESPVRLHANSPGFDAHALTNGLLFVPWTGNTFEVQAYGMTALDLATGATVVTWPLPDVANAASFTPHQAELMDDGTIVLLGTSVLLSKSRNDDDFRTWMAAANTSGAWAWTFEFLGENSLLYPRVHHVRQNPSGDLLVALSEIHPDYSPQLVYFTWRRRTYVIRLSMSNKAELSRTLLPGMMVGESGPEEHCPDPWISTSIRFEKLADGRFVVLRTMLTPDAWPKNKEAQPYPKDGIFGEGTFVDAFGNALGSFKLPPYNINPPYWLDFDGLEPLLVSSTTCGLRVLWDNSIYNLSAWGHQSAEEAGKCGELTYADCQDDDPCTNDGCDPKLGCVHPPFPDGAACSTKGTCKAGACVEP